MQCINHLQLWIFMLYQESSIKIQALIRASPSKGYKECMGWFLAVSTVLRDNVSAIAKNGNFGSPKHMHETVQIVLIRASCVRDYFASRITQKAMPRGLSDNVTHFAIAHTKDFNKKS